MWNDVFMTLSQRKVEKGRPGTRREALRRGDKGCGIGEHRHWMIKDKAQAGWAWETSQV